MTKLLFNNITTYYYLLRKIILSIVFFDWIYETRYELYINV